MSRPGAFEDHVADEGGRQAAVDAEDLFEVVEFFLCREFREEEEVYGFFEAEAVVLSETGDEVADVDSAVEEFAFAGDFGAVWGGFFGFDAGDFGEAGDDAVAVDVSEAAHDVVFGVHFRADVVVRAGFVGERADVWSYLRIILNGILFNKTASLRNLIFTCIIPQFLYHKMHTM